MFKLFLKFHEHFFARFFRNVAHRHGFTWRKCMQRIKHDPPPTLTNQHRWKEPSPFGGGKCYVTAVERQECMSRYIKFIKQLVTHFMHCHLPPTAPPRGPAPGPRPLTCGVSSECSGTRSYETTSRDQRGKIQMFFSSTGACRATKSPIANHRSSIVAQLYFASVTQMFLMPLFVNVESGSSKLLRTVSKSGSNGCKERSRPQKMLMRIKTESF